MEKHYEEEEPDSRVAECTDCEKACNCDPGRYFFAQYLLFYERCGSDITSCTGDAGKQRF